MSEPVVDPLAETVAMLTASLDGVRSQDVGALRDALRERLRGAQSLDEHRQAKADVRSLVGRAQRVASLLEGVLAEVGRLRADWLTERRYTQDGLMWLQDGLRERSLLDGEVTAEPWIQEILNALVAHEIGPAAVLADTLRGELSGDARTAAEAVLAGIGKLGEGDLAAGLDVVTALANGRTADLLALSPTTRALAHRVAASLCRQLKLPSSQAFAHLDEALRLDPWNGSTLADRAILYVAEANVDRAVREANRAVEVQPDKALGYLVLGVCAESSGQFAQADRLYGDGLGHLSTYEVKTIEQAVGGLEPTGRMLLRAAERLLPDQPEDALRLIDKAIERGVADTRLWPLANAHRLRSLALEEIPGQRPAAAEAAIRSGQCLLWSGELVSARAQFERALELDDTSPSTRWYLVDAMRAAAFPLGSPVPDQGAVAAAHDVWETNRDRFGWPGPEFAWAYLTRAQIADWESWTPGANTKRAKWETICYVERALVLDRSQSRFWAESAGYLRDLSFVALPLESIQQALELGGTDEFTLSEKAAILAERGDLAAAMEAATSYEDHYGQTVFIRWIQAWISYRLGNPQAAIGYLQLPVGQDYEVGRYLSLAALCHLSLGDIEAARRDCAAILERAVSRDGDTLILLAVASLSLGDEAAFLDWVRQAKEDPTVLEIDILQTEAFLAASHGDVDGTVEHMLSSVRLTRTVRELDDLVHGIHVQLGILPLRPEELEAMRKAITEGIRDAVQAQREHVQAKPPTGDSELEFALAARGDVTATSPDVIALLAMRARRHWQMGHLEQAADDYERLLEGDFENEARIALRETLFGAFQQAAAEGHVERTVELQNRLIAHGLSGDVERDSVLAGALANAGQETEAASLLAQTLETASDSVDQVNLHQQAGMLALRRQELPSAETHLAVAEELSTTLGDHAGVARLATRRAIVAALAHDTEAVEYNLREALSGWKQAAAFQPDESLRQELRAVLDSGELAGGISSSARSLLADVFATLENAGILLPDSAERLVSELKLADPGSAGSDPYGG